MRIGRSVLVATAMVAALSLPSVAGPAPPPTNILYGFVSTDRTLTLAPPGPFYYVPGDLVIRPGVTLTVEPGVRVAFSTQDTLVGGSDSYRVELVVQGQLDAIASYPDSIRFESASGGTATWYGIRTEGSGALHLENAAVRGAVTAVTCRSSGAHIIRNVAISAVGNGIDAGTSECEVRDSWIVGNGSNSGGAGLTAGPGTVTAFPDSTDVRPTTIAGFGSGVISNGLAHVQNLIVRDCYYGIESSALVNYCTLIRNSNGISLYAGLILNSIVAQGGTGISPPSGSITDYCDFWNNSQNFQGGLYGSNVASFNPFFVDAANNDFRLSSGSIFRNWSNSRGEIGAYGPGPGLPIAVHKSSWARVKAMYK